MKIRILLGIVAALATLASSGCAIDRYSLDSSNLAACKQVVQADDQWRTDPAFKIVYATQSHDGKRVFVGAEVEGDSGAIARFFYFKTPTPKKTASAECLFDGAKLSSWHWISAPPKVVPKSDLPEHAPKTSAIEPVQVKPAAKASE